MDPDVEGFIRSVEAAFGVEFGSAEITGESTLDDLYNSLLLRSSASTSDRCLSSIAFWRLRRALKPLLCPSNNVIKPSTAIETLIPVSHRRKTWSALSHALGLRLPSLEYPSWCTSIMLLISFAPFVTVLLWRGNQFSWWWAASLISVIPLVATLLFHMAKPFAIAVPKYSQTVGETARTLVGLNHAKLAQEFGPSNPEELRKAFRYVVMDITGAEACSLEEDTKLIKLVETTGLQWQV